MGQDHVLLGLVCMLCHFFDLVLAYFLLSAVPWQPIKRKKEGEEKRMTQEEMLLEAAETGLGYVSLVPYPEEIHGWSLPASVVLCLYILFIYCLYFRDHEHEKSRTCTGKRGGSEEKSCCS